MTPQEKDLLLRDLCTRLPCNVYIWYDNGNRKEIRELGLGSLHDFIFNDAIIRPYLRPMSDMTAEEISEFNSIYGDANSTQSDTDVATKIIDFYNERFFDFRGLIPMGLALPATKDMYNINKQ